MPKNTFYSLCDEKKHRIVDAALEEFSVRTFSQASLNQIIKNAGIPKGSFYQYFENKEDLYIHLVQKASEVSKRLLDGVYEKNPDADAFEVTIRTAELSYGTTDIDPRYTSMAMLAILDESNFISEIRRKGASERRNVEMFERDKERGLIKPDVDTEIVANLIS